jgi:hypothetical protein
MIDMCDKGRHGDIAGEKHPLAKLSAKQVASIRKRLGPHGMGRKLAAEYGVAETTISAIKHGVLWGHL